MFGNNFIRVVIKARSPVAFVGMSVMIVASVVKSNHVRNVQHHLVNIVTVRVTRVSVMHATTQQRVKHYGDHRRIGEELVKHGRFEKCPDDWQNSTNRRSITIEIWPVGLQLNYAGRAMHNLYQSQISGESLGKTAKTSPSTV
ncbi:hypothetical protein [Stieleria varia]|uniref:Uncharacterized protein n=1 Tax=Stieleria varia TaxID=2528005 RepID=A0A5C6B0Y9_9BACT|nr:hypothetical protein [Stieleria varia]TWU05580.1 hypothetical protein Pla52n_12940 [Stieleria varia]